MLSDHRLGVPIDGVDEALAVPSLAHGAVEEHPRLALEAEAEGEPRPLEAVPGRDAVGPEAMLAVVGVVVRERAPVGVVVLDDVRAADEALGHPPGALDPQGILAGHHRLDPVHVGVGAAVGLGLGPVARADVEQRAELLLPEVRVEDRERLLEEGLVTGARRGENDEDVLVGELVAGGLGVREPAPVLCVAKDRLERIEPVLGQLGVAGLAEDVRHPRVDPELTRTLEVGRTVAAQPREAAVGVHGALGEGKEPLLFRLKVDHAAMNCRATGGLTAS